MHPRERARTIVETLEERGCAVWEEDGEVRLDDPAEDCLSSTARVILEEYESEILAFLRARAERYEVIERELRRAKRLGPSV